MKHMVRGGNIALALLLSLLLTLGGITVAFAASTQGTELPSYIQNSADKAVWMDACPADGTSSIDAVKWYLDGDGIYYFLLPTSADLSSITIYHNFNSVQIGSTTLESGKAYSLFENGGSYTLRADGKQYDVRVLQSSRIGSMFLTTESGSMDYIHANKENRESGSLLLIDTDGSVSYDGVLDQIKGRGNTTWNNIEKKPYNIKLAKKTALMGMAKSKKWCLLANGQEHSMIRNRFTYDMADEVGLPFAPESRFLDLYANGEYLGTYQLSEKVDVGSDNLVKIEDLQGKTEDAVLAATGVDSVDLSTYSQYNVGTFGRANSRRGYNIPNDPDDITGGYLVEYVYGVAEASGFVTSRNQNVDLRAPEYASKAQINYIADFMQDMEDALYSSTGYNSKGKHYTDYIDAQDAAKMYLIQELSMNMDCGISSTFLYKESDAKGDGKLHISPAWDFDIAFGNLLNSKDGVKMTDYTKFFASISKLSNTRDTYTVFGALCSHDDFNELAAKIWREEFVPAFNIAFGKAEGTGRLKSFETYKALTQDASVMNYIRWDLTDNLLVPAAGETHDKQIAYMINWTEGRYYFLDSAFASIDDLKAQTKRELIAFFETYNSTDYSASDWEKIVKAKDDGLANIENAKTAAAVIGAKTAAVTAMKEIAGVKLYFDNAETKWEEVYAFWWNSKTSCSWPGKLMKDEGNGMYSLTFPADVSYVIFNNNLPERVGKEQTVDLMAQDGSNLFVPDTETKHYDNQKEAYCYSGAWKSYSGEPQYKQGDANPDGLLNLQDVLAIQKHLAKYHLLTGTALKNADADLDGFVTVQDALILQKLFAGMIAQLPDAA